MKAQDKECWAAHESRCATRARSPIHADQARLNEFDGPYIQAVSEGASKEVGRHAKDGEGVEQLLTKPWKDADPTGSGEES